METVFQGTTVKLMLTASNSEEQPSLEDCDFDVYVWVSNRNSEQSQKPEAAIHIAKNDCIKKDPDNYIVEVPTTQFGPGYIIVRMEIQVPDNDCASGKRNEVLQLLPNIQVM